MNLPCRQYVTNKPPWLCWQPHCYIWPLMFLYISWHYHCAFFWLKYRAQVTIKTLPVLPNMPILCQGTQTPVKLTPARLTNLLFTIVPFNSSFKNQRLLTMTFLDNPEINLNRHHHIAVWVTYDTPWTLVLIGPRGDLTFCRWAFKKFQENMFWKGQSK